MFAEHAILFDEDSDDSALAPGDPGTERSEDVPEDDRVAHRAGTFSVLRLWNVSVDY